MRPILMTSFAMIAGMLPTASGFGESGEQVAPLGRAVIAADRSPFATLFILPGVFAMLQRKRPTRAVSIDPEDPSSAYYEPKPAGA